MGLNKVAILIDGGFFIQRFRFLHKKDPVKKDVEDLISNILKDLNGKNPHGTIHPDQLL